MVLSSASGTCACPVESTTPKIAAHTDATNRQVAGIGPSPPGCYAWRRRRTGAERASGKALVESHVLATQSYVKRAGDARGIERPACLPGRTVTPAALQRIAGAP